MNHSAESLGAGDVLLIPAVYHEPKPGGSPGFSFKPQPRAQWFFKIAAIPTAFHTCCSIATCGISPASTSRYSRFQPRRIGSQVQSQTEQPKILERSIILKRG